MVLVKGQIDQVDQQNRTESPETGLDIYGQMIFNKDTKATQQRKNSYQQMTLKQLNIYVQNSEP